MTADDVPACHRIINRVIEIGGSTAHQPFSFEAFKQYYFHDPAISNVALEQGRVVGFQAVFEQEPGLYSIGSFTDRDRPVRGAGRALADQMIKACRAAGGHTLIAKITSDNTGGLAFYAKVGFQDWKTVPNHLTRPDGTVVDQIIKRIIL